MTKRANLAITFTFTPTPAGAAAIDGTDMGQLLGACGVLPVPGSVDDIRGLFDPEHPNIDDPTVADQFRRIRAGLPALLAAAVDRGLLALGSRWDGRLGFSTR